MKAFGILIFLTTITGPVLKAQAEEPSRSELTCAQALSPSANGGETLDTRGWPLEKRNFPRAGVSTLLKMAPRTLAIASDQALDSLIHGQRLVGRPNPIIKLKMTVSAPIFHAEEWAAVELENRELHDALFHLSVKGPADAIVLLIETRPEIMTVVAEGENPELVIAVETIRARWQKAQQALKDHLRLLDQQDALLDLQKNLYANRLKGFTLVIDQNNSFLHHVDGVMRVSTQREQELRQALDRDRAYSEQVRQDHSDRKQFVMEKLKQWEKLLN